MTRKDYRAIVTVLRDQGYGVKTVEAFADVFERVYPNFDREKFLNAWRWGTEK